MAGFERIVRPVLPPSIRPTNPSPPAQTDNSAATTLSGQGNNPISLSHSSSASWTADKKEWEYRIYDLVRVYDEKDLRPDDQRNSVDVQVTTQVHMRDITGVFHDYKYWPPKDETDPTTGRLLQKVLQRNIKEFIESSTFFMR